MTNYDTTTERIKDDLVAIGESIHPYDYALYVRLHDTLSMAEALLQYYHDGVESIANSSCCSPCQEARLVAREILEGLK